MIYKETGQYKSSYKSDHAIFPLLQDKIAFSTLMFIAFLIIPFVINSYWEKAILVPFLIFSLAAIGLNILTGYCGQVSLGTGGFMAVGAFSTYKIMTYFPDMNIMIIILISGLITAAVGIIFGLPSLRIKGFYLAVATLASQVFSWFGCLTKFHGFIITLIQVKSLFQKGRCLVFPLQEQKPLHTQLICSV